MFGNSLASVPVVADMNGGSKDNSGFADGGWWVLIILFALFGWGRGGFGGQSGGGFDGSIPNGFALATDFAALEGKMDNVNNGLCSGFYNTSQQLNNGFAAAQQTMTQGFAGLNQAVVQQGYETRLGEQATQAQLASCCCDLQSAIQANTTQGVMNTSAIQQQIQQCCCDNEKSQMETRFQMQQDKCETVQAIDKVGDRIIDYMTTQETQRLRDENQSLRFQASQVAQNQYLTDMLRPTPIPAYQACNPWAGQPYGSCCSC